MSIVTIENVIVSQKNFSTVKYYFFGLVKLKWRFEKTDNINLKSYGSDFGAEGDYEYPDTGGSELGCLFSIFTVFTKTKIIRKVINIKKIDVTQKVICSVDILIDKFEYKLLQEFVR